MPHVLTRQQLHAMIQERAVSRIAPELGISDVALRKTCIRHAIPLPDARYRGRLHAGRPVEPVALGPAPEGVSERIVINPRGLPAAPGPVADAIAAAAAQAVPVTVPDRLHALVARTMALARKTPVNQTGAIADLGPGAFRIRAHPDTLARAGSF